jgi:hypothetical protein
VSLILKNKKGKVIDKCGYEEEGGNIFYKEKKVGTFELEHDSALGSYYLYTIDNGKQYHDHYFIEETIIQENNL